MPDMVCTGDQKLSSFGNVLVFGTLALLYTVPVYQTYSLLIKLIGFSAGLSGFLAGVSGFWSDFPAR